MVGEYRSRVRPCGARLAPWHQVGAALPPLNEIIERTQEGLGVSDQMWQQVSVDADHLAIGGDVIPAPLPREAHETLRRDAHMVGAKSDDLGAAKADEEAESENDPCLFCERIREPHPPPYVIGHR
ncbi:MAG: hypothetical protein JWN67_4423 [Actinomycetia bacterium]|nr:hypothetical protein [Actinomycetes bacterium]